MQKKYSKSSEDIFNENINLLLQNKALLLQQNVLSANFNQFPFRKICLLCKTDFNNPEWFIHRSVKYLSCAQCGHIQTEVLLPDNFPNHNKTEYSFEGIYPALDLDKYISRRDRIYLPKLQWALESLTEYGYSKIELLNKKWLEIGAGAGYFLHALNEQGARNILGIETNTSLIKLANEKLNHPFVEFSNIEIHDFLNQNDIDIIIAFFVLEHLNNPNAFWTALKQQSRGTVFIFSVPMFSLATLIESAFLDHAGRNLDNVLHTQLYTEQSIEYGLKLAGYDRIATWYFGQDGSDLIRLITKKIEQSYSENLLKKIIATLNKLNDPLQSAVDAQQFCDARHIIAIKS